MKSRVLKRLVSMLLAACLLVGLAETALAATKVSETVKLPVTGMKVTGSYASGSYYTALLQAMKDSAGKSPQQRFVALALSQKGYKGSTSSTELNGNGDKGIYTEYSNHRGVAGYDWCAAFVSWCAEAAGLSTSVMKRSNYAGGKIEGVGATWADPEGCGAPGTFHRIWSDDFSTYLGNYQPQVGDLCLFMKSENTWSGTSHVEIVTSVSSSKNSSGGYNFTTVGRKSGNKVDTETYSTTASRSKNSSVHKFKGFFTPNWSAASVWSSSMVSGIDVDDKDEYVTPPGKPTLNVSVGSSNVPTTFSWGTTSNTEYYTLRVYNASGTEILLEGGIRNTSFSTQLAAGKYTAKLASVNNTAGLWTFSDVISFTVTNTVTPGKPTLRVTPGNNLRDTAFTWDATANTEYYTLRIFYDDAEGDLYQLRGGITGTSFYADLFPYSFSATLAAVNKTDGTWTFSDRVYFTIQDQTAPSLGTPVVSRIGNGKKYNVYEGSVDWKTAQAMTKSGYGCLAPVLNQDEQEIVADAVSEFGKPCWLGGYRSFGDEQWTWTYVSAMPYTNWASGEPSGAFGKENYIAMLPNGLWIDHNGIPAMSDGAASDDIGGFVVRYGVDSISVSVDQGAFFEGWPVEREDLTVMITFDDWTTVEVTDYTIEQNSTAIGQQTVRIRYGGGYKDVTVTYVPDPTAVQGGSAPNELILPDGLTRIEDEAFMNAAVRTVRFPLGLASIGARAFAGCEELERVFIPGSVTEIDDSAFEDCGDMWIFAPAGSAAESFAQRHTLKFFADN